MKQIRYTCYQENHKIEQFFNNVLLCIYPCTTKMKQIRCICPLKKIKKFNTLSYNYVSIPASKMKQISYTCPLEKIK